jgi:antitoxin YefM
MATETTYTSLRKNLASVLDQVVDQQETVIVRRRGSRDVALIPLGELDGLIETAHLLRSPRNARHLL